MKYKNIVLTGGRGFIGFNALRLWKKEHPDVRFACVDACTYADRYMVDEKNRWLDENGVPRKEIVLGDAGAMNDLIWFAQKFGADAIVHMGAESHVDSSIGYPSLFYRSNVMGTVDVLNAAKELGVRTHVVSTDEVYGETFPDDRDGCVRPEARKIRPSSPYSSSKAAADLAAAAYARTYGMNVTVSRCTNNVGPWQMPEKMVPTIVRKAMAGEKIPVYGDGGQRRHWIHVDDHNRAVFRILQEGDAGRAYDVGPQAENWITNMELVRFVLGRVGAPESLIEHVKDRPGHDVSYYLPPSEPWMESRGWKDAVASAVDWYAEKSERRAM